MEPDRGDPTSSFQLGHVVDAVLLLQGHHIGAVQVALVAPVSQSKGHLGFQIYSEGKGKEVLWTQVR